MLATLYWPGEARPPWTVERRDRLLVQVRERQEECFTERNAACVDHEGYPRAPSHDKSQPGNRERVEDVVDGAPENAAGGADVFRADPSGDACNDAVGAGGGVHASCTEASSPGMSRGGTVRLSVGGFTAELS